MCQTITSLRSVGEGHRLGPQLTFSVVPGVESARRGDKGTNYSSLRSQSRREGATIPGYRQACGPARPLCAGTQYGVGLVGAGIQHWAGVVGAGTELWAGVLASLSLRCGLAS